MAYSLAQRDGRLYDRNEKSADGVEFFSRVGATSLHPILALKARVTKKKPDLQVLNRSYYRFHFLSLIHI